MATIVPIRSSSQAFLDIEDIKDNLLMTTDGSCSLIIETTAVNFSLLSEKEQDAMIFAYSGLLNSLSFPIQLFLRSKHKDISGYLKKLEAAEAKQTNPQLKDRIKNYREFISTTIKERNVLDKKFYIVIPFSVLELGPTNVRGLMKKKKLPYPKQYIWQRAKTTLIPKRDHILRQLNRLGLKGTQLSTSKIVELFHDIYNQNSINKVTDPKEFTSAIISQKHG